MSTDLWLPSVLVLCQIDPRDGAKWSEELLQVCLTGVLRKIGHTNSSIVISCREQTYSVYTEDCSCSATGTQVKSKKKKKLVYYNLNPPLRLGCMDSPLRVPPSLKLGGTYFPVLLCAGCAGSGSAGDGGINVRNLSTVKHQVWRVSNEKLINICWSHEVLTVPEPTGLSLSAVESPSCSASSFCMGPRVSLYGQRVVQWSPLQIRQDTIFCPFSLFMGSSSWSWAFKSCKRKDTQSHEKITDQCSS